MSNPLNLSLNIEWIELDTDNSFCSECKELIIGKMFQAVVFIRTEPIYTKDKVCSYCYQNDTTREKRKKIGNVEKIQKDKERIEYKI